MIVRFDQGKCPSPDHFGFVESLARPGHPPAEQQRPRDRPRLGQLLGRLKRPVQQLLGLVHVGLEVDRDVTEKAQGESERDGVVVRFRQGDGAGQRFARQAILAEPVARLAESRQDPGLAHRPAALGPGHEKSAVVAIDRRADLHAPASAIARDQQRVGRAVRSGPIVRVEVERSPRRELEVVGGQRSMAFVQQVLGGEIVQAQPLSFREAGVSDVLQRGVAHAPGRRTGRLVVAHDELCVFEVLKLFDGPASIDDRQLLEIEAVHEHR